MGKDVSIECVFSNKKAYMEAYNRLWGPHFIGWNDLLTKLVV